MPTPLAAPSPALARHRPFALFWCARVAGTIAYQMQAVAIGWQIYDLTGSALDLGLVGLVQFVPVVLLALVVGHVADRHGPPARGARWASSNRASPPPGSALSRRC